MTSPRIAFVLGGLAIAASARSAAAQVAALPEGNTGIASRHLNDQGIASDSQVLFSDNFESGYTPDVAITGGATALWNNSVNGDTRVTAAGAHGGSLGLEFRIPNSPSAEVGAGVARNLAPAQEVVFLRYYSKFDPSFAVWGSSHNGANISAGYWTGPGSGPGIPADGSNKFLIAIENALIDPNGSAGDTRVFLDMLGFKDRTSLPSPGAINAYVYWPEQRSQWGDHWYLNGAISPYDPNIGNGNTFSEFTSRPNVVPELGRWYCYEMMVKANTAGGGTWKADGRVAFWLDGKLIADWPNLVLRKTPDLQLDLFGLSLHANPNPAPATKKFYDDVVAATSYIGPMYDGTPGGTGGTSSGGTSGENGPNPNSAGGGSSEATSGCEVARTTSTSTMLLVAAAITAFAWRRRRARCSP